MMVWPKLADWHFRNLLLSYKNKNLIAGPWNDEVMLETFVQNQQVAVSNLGDDSFEHLTQAASGATTGDWFVML